MRCVHKGNHKNEGRFMCIAPELTVLLLANLQLQISKLLEAWVGFQAKYIFISIFVPVSICPCKN